MYKITYKNILKRDKTRIDFEKWIERHWPIHQKWGAKAVRIWSQQEKGIRILYCQYTVNNLKKWNEGALGPDAEITIQHLGKIVDLNQIAMKITMVPNFQNNTKNDNFKYIEFS
jgi:hypothetical protein